MTLGIGNSRRDRPSIKKEQAEERKAAWDSMTAKEKINVLDKRLGKNIGAKKQRAILADELDKNKFTINQDQRKIEQKFSNTIKTNNDTHVKPVVAHPTPTPASDEGTQDTENTITIFKSSESDGFIAKIRGIKETAKGATKAEARANAKRLINAQK